MAVPAGQAIESKSVAALFRDGEKAGRAYRALLDRGYSRDDISIIMSEEARRVHYVSEDTTRGDDTKALEGGGAGAAIGGVSGAIIAAIAAIGTNVVFPGIGLIVAGPLAAALAGAGAGGATGALIGALIGAGIPEDEAKRLETGIREGGIILSASPNNIVEADEIAGVWEDHDGELIFKR